MNIYGCEMDLNKTDDEILSDGNYHTKNFRTGEQKKRERLYFGSTVTHISINDIQSKIKDNISKYTNWINEYVSVINNFLTDEVKLDINKMIFDIKRKYDEHATYEDDGNTQCEGFNYDVLWALPIGKITNTNEWHIRQGFAERYLYFIYTDEEKLFDNKVKGSRYFSIYLAGVKLPREDNHVERIDYNNNNYNLNSVLNKGNIVSIVLKIQDLQKKINLINELKSINLFE